MRTETITLPSRAVVTIKSLQVADASKIAASKKNASDSVTQIIDLAVVERVDLGPYTKSRDFASWYSADRFVIALWARVLTYGATYDFPFTCEECGARNEWTIDLTRDITIKPIPAASLERTAANEGIPIGDWHGVSVFGRLLTGRDDVTAETAHGGLVDTLTARIHSIDGDRTREKISAFVGDVELTELPDLVAFLDQADGGAETKIGVRCAHCDYTQDEQLPLGARFFRPSRKQGR